jgi:stress response protein YsnF
MTEDDPTPRQHEIALHEEVDDIDKRVVPKDRDRLDTETEHDEITVNDTMRKERIELEQHTPPRPRVKRSNLSLEQR